MSVALRASAVGPGGVRRAVSAKAFGRADLAPALLSSPPPRDRGARGGGKLSPSASISDRALHGHCNPRTNFETD